MEDFSSRVKRLRELCGLTQLEVARKLDVSPAAVGAWENNRSRPRLDKLEKLAELLGTTAYDLLNGNEPMRARPSSVLVPLLGTTHMGEFSDEDECDRMVEVPASVVEAHPGGFCVYADGECMNNRYPSDSVLFVDPHMQPFDGCAVLAETDQYQSIVRKYSKGSTALMLSPDSHSDAFDDIIVRAGDAPVKLKGVVVWYQAEKDLR